MLDSLGPVTFREVLGAETPKDKDKVSSCLTRIGRNSKSAYVQVPDTLVLLHEAHSAGTMAYVDV